MDTERALKVAQARAMLWEVIANIEAGIWYIEDFDDELVKLVQVWSAHIVG